MSDTTPTGMKAGLREKPEHVIERGRAADTTPTDGEGTAGVTFLRCNGESGPDHDFVTIEGQEDLGCPFCAEIKLGVVKESRDKWKSRALLWASDAVERQWEHVDSNPESVSDVEGEESAG